MALTPDEQIELNGLLAHFGQQTPQAAPALDRPGFFSRLGQGFANTPSNIAGGLVNAGVNVLNYGQPPALRLDNVNVPKPYDVPPSQSWSDSFADLVPGLAAAVGTAMIPGGAVAKGAQLLGMGGKTAAILGDVAGGAVLGASQSPEEAAGTAAEFGALGAANRFLPAPWKIAANAAIPLMGQVARGRDPTSRDALVSMGANVLVPALLGQYGRSAEGARLMADRTRQPVATADDLSILQRPPEGESLLSPAYQREAATAPPEPFAPYGRPTPQPGVDAPPMAFEDVQQGLARYRPAEAAGTLPPQEFPGDYPLMRTVEQARESEAPRTITPGDETASALREPIMDVQPPVVEPSGKGMTRSPKFFEFAGIDPSNPLLQYGAGAIAGGVTNPLVDDDPEHSLLRKVGEGALRGLGTVYAGKRLMAGIAASPLLHGEPLGITPRGKRLLSSPVDEVKPNTAAIGDAYRQLVKSTGYQDVKITDLQRESGAPLADVQSFLRDQWQVGKAHLSGGEPSYYTPEQKAAHVEINGDKMYMARLPEEAPSTVLGAVYSLPDVKRLLHTKAEEYESGDPSPLGWIARRLEQNFNLGKSVETGRAEQFAKGAERDFFEKAKPVIQGLAHTTPVESKALLAYEASPRDPSDIALMRSAVRPEVADAMLAGEKLEGYGQQLLAKGSDDPRKQALVDDTEGTYRTTKYKFATQPKEWISDLRANPKLREDLVNEFVTTNKYPGFTKEEIEAQVDGFVQSKLRGEPDFGPSNPSKTDPHLWTKRKDLTDTEKAFLGEYKDPAQRMAFTLQKIGSNIAQAKKAITLDEMGKKGDLTILTIPERQTAMAAARAAGDSAKIEELAALKPVPSNPAFGVLSGKLVPHDVLDSLNAHNELWTNGWLKNFSGPTSWMKGMLTVANPATHARQIIQTPLMAAISRVAPWELWSAAKMMMAKGGEWEEAVRNGIVGADFSAQDLSRGALEMDATFNPSRAGTVARAVKGFAQKAYGMPDNVVRFAAYYKAKARYFGEGNAQGLKGAELETFAQNKATDFVNRYTMNYGAVANAVKVARETPFVSPFISYQTEMLRILKNLGEDALTGSASDRVWALGNLAGLIAAPLLAAKAFESKLSDKDQKEWDRVQRLSPDYSGAQIRVPMGRNKDGSFKYVNIANLVPAGDSAALARNLANGDGARIFASNPFVGWEKTPIFNTIAEQVSGRDSVTDRKLDALGRVASVAKSFTPPLTPGVGYEGKRLLSSITPNDQGGLGITNSRTGQENSPGNFLLRQAGIPLANVQPAALLRRAKSDFEDAKAGAKMELNQVAATNASPDVKGIALMRYQAKVKDARARLLSSVK